MERLENILDGSMKTIMKNKIIQTITSALIGIGCFIGGTYYATEKFNTGLDRVMDEYEVISDKVDVFIKVSDTKTVRTYVKQLNNILDDINFLNKMIKSGQLADEALSDILKNQQKINNQLVSMITKEEFVGYVAKADNRDESIGYHVDELWEWTYTKEAEDTTNNNSIVNKLNTIQTDLDTIRGLIKEIEDSKIGKKIFK